MYPPTVEGGPCEYVCYKGDAEITSFAQRMERLRSGEREAYEMKFRFSPQEEVDFDIENWVEREFTEIIYADGPYGQYSAFVEKNKQEIKPGKIFPGILRVIVRGTCTPRIFEFFSSEQELSGAPHLECKPKFVRTMMATGTIIAYEAGKSITIRGSSGKVISLDIAPGAKTRGDIQ